MTWKDTILTEYSSSTNILSIIETFHKAVSLEEFTEKFIKEVWDVTSCGSYGLDVWGKIVGISRYITAPVEFDNFGFSEALGDSETYPSPFNASPFYGGNQETTNIRLADNAYRTLILCKSFSNISVATIPDINKFLSMMFRGRGRAYCVNHRDMTVGLRFEFYLEPFEESILTNYEVVPIPSGVRYEITQVPNEYFGFALGDTPFNDGQFYTG